MEMIYQYAINTKKIVNINEVKEFLNIVSAERKVKINRFYFQKDKVHSLFAEIILKYALWEQYGLNSTYIEFGQSKYGKPYLVNQKGLYFNLSHSGNWVLCGLGDTPIGLDVEEIKDKKMNLFNRIFTKEEHDFIFMQPLDQRIKSFYKIWTLKESYVKYIGKGLNIPFDSFLFQFNEDGIQFYLKGERDCSLVFTTGQLDGRHVISLCVKSQWNDRINSQVKILTLEQLQKWRNL